MTVKTATQTIFPTIRYKDVRHAIDWLKNVVGFTELMVVPGKGGTIVHAELRCGRDVLMLGSTTDGSDGRLVVTTGPTWLYLVVDDPDAHHARAVAAGAEIVQPLKDEEYGSRGYTARDPEGNLWSVGTYRPKED